jgi:branched-chain amino acid transport system substrate-binding protein
MSKSMMRAFALIVTAIMLLGSLAACGEPGSSDDNETSGAASTTSAPQSTSANASTSSPATSASPATSGASGETINVGVILPLTGPSANTGEDTLNGIKLAVDNANASGELPGNIKLVVDDDRSTPSEGVSAVQKQINNDHVSVVMCAFNSSVSLAVRDVTFSNKIPQLTLGAAADSLTQGESSEFVWRAHMYNQLQADQFATYVTDALGAKKVAVLVENTDYGSGLRDLWVPHFESAGIDIVANEAYNPADTDFLGILTKIKNADPDVFVIEALVTQAGIILKQAKSLGLDVTTVDGIGGFDQNELPELAGGAQDGAKFMLWFSPQANAEAQAFADAYTEKYDKEPNSFAAQGYTVATSLINAIKQAGSGDSAKIQEAMPSVEFDSPIGHIKFGEDHNATASIYMAEWQGKEKVLLEVQPAQPK